MTTPAAHPHPQQIALKGALIPFGVAAVPLLIGWTIARGADGGLGALLATAIVAVFFGSGFYLERKVRTADPMVVMALAMAGFAIKFMGLAGILVALRGTNLFDTTAFASTAIILAVAWLAGEVRAFTKGQFFYTDAGDKSTNTG